MSLWYPSFLACFGMGPSSWIEANNVWVRQVHSGFQCSFVGSRAVSNVGLVLTCLASLRYIDKIRFSEEEQLIFEHWMEVSCLLLIALRKFFDKPVLNSIPSHVWDPGLVDIPWLMSTLVVRCQGMLIFVWKVCSADLVRCHGSHRCMHQFLFFLRKRMYM